MSKGRDVSNALLAFVPCRPRSSLKRPVTPSVQ